MKHSTVIQFTFCVSFLSHAMQATHLTVTPVNAKAIVYVGNTFVENGQMQLELLIREGLQKDNHVLEIGCGALVAGIPIISFVDRDHYVGIDPNKWLIDDSLQVPENAAIVQEKKPLFLNNFSFDASSVDRKFDYIISHSIISHAPLWQLQLFLRNCANVLNKGGKVIFSVRLTEPNEYDPSGKKEESTTMSWQYPGNTFFHKETIIREASIYFSSVEYKPYYTYLITQTDRGAFHDWFVLTK